jgi:hypothetical protein
MKLLPLETELGFEVIEVIGLFEPYGEIPRRYIAKILGDADIIVRIGNENDPTYQHWRFGKHEGQFSTKEWHPISSLFGKHANDVKQVKSDAEFGADEHQNGHKVLLIKAEIKRITKT